MIFIVCCGFNTIGLLDFNIPIAYIFNELFPALQETDKTLKACSDRMDAALRARHLMISSLAPTKRARRASGEYDSYCDDCYKKDKSTRSTERYAYQEYVLLKLGLVG